MNDLLSLRCISVVYNNLNCSSSWIGNGNGNIQQKGKSVDNERKAEKLHPLSLPFIKECMVDDNVMPLWHPWFRIFISYTLKWFIAHEGAKWKMKRKVYVPWKNLQQFFCVFILIFRTFYILTRFYCISQHFEFKFYFHSGKKYKKIRTSGK